MIFTAAPVPNNVKVIIPGDSRITHVRVIRRIRRKHVPAPGGRKERKGHARESLLKHGCSQLLWLWDLPRQQKKRYAPSEKSERGHDRDESHAALPLLLLSPPRSFQQRDRSTLSRSSRPEDGFEHFKTEQTTSCGSGLSFRAPPALDPFTEVGKIWSLVMYACVHSRLHHSDGVLGGRFQEFPIAIIANGQSRRRGQDSGAGARHDRPQEG